MSEQLHKKIVEFLAKEFARREGRMAVRLELVPERSQPIRTWDREEDPTLFEEARCEDFATEVLRWAVDHAEGAPSGVCKFTLRTVQHLGGAAAKTFTVRVDSEGELGATDSSQLVSQLTRHLEVKDRMIFQMHNASLAHFEQQLDRQAKWIERLETDRMAHFNEREAMLSQQTERDIEMAQAEASEQRKNAVVQKLIQLAPVVVSQLGKNGKGGPIKAIANGVNGPAGNDQRDEMINELADSLAPEQMAKLAGTLTPAQQILMMELFTQAQAARNAKAATSEADDTQHSFVNGKEPS